MVIVSTLPRPSMGALVSTQLRVPLVGGAPAHSVPPSAQTQALLPCAPPPPRVLTLVPSAKAKRGGKREGIMALAPTEARKPP